MEQNREPRNPQQRPTYSHRPLAREQRWGTQGPQHTMLEHLDIHVQRAEPGHRPHTLTTFTQMGHRPKQEMQNYEAPRSTGENLADLDGPAF